MSMSDEKAPDIKKTQKMFKAKDPHKKLEAIEKCRDFDFLRGGCLGPLVELLVPKKNIDLMRNSLAVLSEFVLLPGGGAEGGGEGEGEGETAANNPFPNALLILREGKKKSNKFKAGELFSSLCSFNEPAVKLEAVRCFSAMCDAVAAMPAEEKDRVAFHNSLSASGDPVTAMSSLLQACAASEASDEVDQMCGHALRAISFVHGVDVQRAISSLIADKASLAALCTFSQRPQHRSQALSILSAIALMPNGEGVAAMMGDGSTACADSLLELLVSGLDELKDVCGAKGDASEVARIESCLTDCVAILTRLFQNSADGGADSLKSLAEAVMGVLSFLNERFAGEDSVISETAGALAATVCHAVGVMADLGDDLRRVLLSSDALNFILPLLVLRVRSDAEASLVGDDAEAEADNADISTAAAAAAKASAHATERVRAVADKAVHHLVTDAGGVVDGSILGAGEDGGGGDQEGEGEAKAAFLSAEVLAVVASSDDSDAKSRACRLASLLLSNRANVVGAGVTEAFVPVLLAFVAWFNSEETGGIGANNGIGEGRNATESLRSLTPDAVVIYALDGLLKLCEESADGCVAVVGTVPEPGSEGEGDSGCVALLVQVLRDGKLPTASGDRGGPGWWDAPTALPSPVECTWDAALASEPPPSTDNAPGGKSITVRAQAMKLLTAIANGDQRWRVEAEVEEVAETKPAKGKGKNKAVEEPVVERHPDDPKPSTSPAEAGAKYVANEVSGLCLELVSADLGFQGWKVDQCGNGQVAGVLSSEHTIVHPDLRLAALDLLAAIASVTGGREILVGSAKGWVPEGVLASPNGESPAVDDAEGGAVDETADESTKEGQAFAWWGTPYGDDAPAAHSAVWQYVRVLSGCVGVLLGDTSAPTHLLAAVRALNSLCCDANRHDARQTAVSDTMCGVAASMGALVPLVALTCTHLLACTEPVDVAQAAQIAKSYFDETIAKTDSVEVVELSIVEGMCPAPVVHAARADTNEAKDDDALLLQLSTESTSLSLYLFSRGKVREEYWATLPVPVSTEEAAEQQDADEQREEKFGVPDPNAGPDRGQWANALNVQCDFPRYALQLVTPSAAACTLQDGRLEQIKALIDAGADADRPDGAMRTPLMLALSNGRHDVVDVLMSEAKVQVDCSDANGTSPLLVGFVSPTGPDSEAFASTRLATELNYIQWCQDQATRRSVAAELGSLIASHKREREKAANILQCKARQQQARKRTSKIRAKKKPPSKKGGKKRKSGESSRKRPGAGGGRSNRSSKADSSKEGGAATMIQNRHRQRRATREVASMKFEKEERQREKEEAKRKVEADLAAKKAREAEQRAERIRQEEQDARDVRDMGSVARAGALAPTSLLRSLLQAGADPNVSDADGNFPLHWALAGVRIDGSMQFFTCSWRSGEQQEENGGGGEDAQARTCTLALASADAQWESREAEREDRLSIVELLLEHGANADACNAEGQTCLHTAVLHGHDACVTKLLAAGANPNVMDRQGHLPLHLACMAVGPNAESLVTQLLTFGEGRPMLRGEHCDDRKGLGSHDKLLMSLDRIMNAGLANVLTPPAIAEKQCRAPQLVTTNAGQMAGEEAPPGSRATALLYACGAALPLSNPGSPREEAEHITETRARLIHMLLAAAQIDSSSSDETVADFACVTGPAGLMPLHVACMGAGGGTAVLEALLAVGGGGTDPWLDCVDSSGLSPLHYALRSSERAAVMIMEAGASPLPPGSNPPPLHLACEFGRDPSLITALLDRSTVIQGVDVNIASSNPEDLPERYSGTALHLAAEGGHASAVKVLLEVTELDMGAVRPATGSTALHLACGAGHADIVTLLVSHPSVLCAATDADGNTPLVVAVAAGHIDCVSALLLSDGVGKDDIVKAVGSAAATSALTIAEEANMNAKDEEAVAASEDMLTVLLGALGIDTAHVRSIDGEAIPPLDSVEPVLLEAHVHRSFAYGVTPSRWNDGLLKSAEQLQEEKEQQAAALKIQGKARQRTAKRRMQKKRDQKKRLTSRASRRGIK